MKMEPKNWLVIIGFFIGAAVAAYQYYEGVKSGKEAEKLQENLIEKTDSLAVANGRIADLQGEVNEKADSIIASNNDLISAQKHTIDMIMGKGIPMLGFRFVAGDIFDVTVYSESEFPIYDIYTQIRDVKLITQTCRSGYKDNVLHVDQICFNQYVDTLLETKILLPRGRFPIGQYQLNEDNFLDVIFQTKSTLYRYYMYIKISDSQMFMAYKRYEMKNGEYHYIDKYSSIENLPDDYFETNFYPLDMEFATFY